MEKNLPEIQLNGAVKKNIKKTPQQSLHQRLSMFLPFISLVILIVIFSLGHSAFLSVPNFYNVLRQSSVLLVAALGGTFIILMGSIDLSVGSIIAMCGIVTPTLLDMGFGIPGAVIGGLIAGCLAGFLNGLIFAYGKIPSFLVTLGTMAAMEGLALKLTGGRTISIFNQSYKWLSSGSLVGALPNIALWAVIIYVFCIFLATRTRFGRYMYAIGGGEKVAKLSGVAINRFKLYAFAFSGTLAGFAGVLLAARIGARTARMADGFLLDSIAAVVMGGTSLTGGIGGPHRTILGVLIISILSNGLNILSIDPYTQIMIKGSVVILAVFLTIDRSKITVNK
jgi:ribose/xylose/arabinose/galactoside ABC-type transport system permease subunit